MMKQVKFILVFLLALTIGGVVLQPALTHALDSAGGGSSSGGGSTPTATPTISVPTAVATAGNVITLSKFGSPSYLTHDMIACCVEQNNGAGDTLSSTTGGLVGWFNIGPSSNNFSSGTWLDQIGHCIMPVEPASYTLGGLAATVATQQACILLRNTACETDGAGANGTGSSSTTVNYASQLLTATNDMMIDCASWVVGASNVSMSTNPASLTVDVTVTGVGSTSDGIQIGHIPQAAPTTIAATTGTLSAAQNSGSNVFDIVPIH